MKFKNASQLIVRTSGLGILATCLIILINVTSSTETAKASNCGLWDCWVLDAITCTYQQTTCYGWKCKSSLTPECSWGWNGQCPFGSQQPSNCAWNGGGGGGNENCPPDCSVE